MSTLKAKKVTSGSKSIGWIVARLRARKNPAIAPRHAEIASDLELEEEGVLAQRQGGVLVLTDCPQNPPQGVPWKYLRAIVAMPTVSQITRSNGKSESGSLQKLATTLSLIDSETSRQASG